MQETKKNSPFSPRCFDSHAHLDDPRFDEDRPELLAQMRDQGVLCTCIGSNMPTSRAAVALAEAHDGLWAATAVHPHDAKDFADADVQQLREWARLPKVVAIGEIGLDYYYDLSPRPVQREVFAQQLDLAAEIDMPVVLHIRDAHGDVTDMLRARRGHLPAFVVHCFSGSWESAKIYLDMGAMISFAGPVTFKKSLHLQEVARKVPAERLMIETDSPYLSPEPVRGRRNNPCHVAHVADFVAALRGIPAEDLAQATVSNALRFYRIAL